MIYVHKIQYKTQNIKIILNLRISTSFSVGSMSV